MNRLPPVKVIRHVEEFVDVAFAASEIDPGGRSPFDSMQIEDLHSLARQCYDEGISDGAESLDVIWRRARDRERVLTDAHHRSVVHDRVATADHGWVVAVGALLSALDDHAIADPAVSVAVDNLRTMVKALG